jgi:hypothetical protein
MSTAKTRYHFNIVTASETVHDLEGTELPSLEAARAYAIEDARTLMSIAVLEGRDISGRRIEVTNEAGDVLLTLRFREALTYEDGR